MRDINNLQQLRDQMRQSVHIAGSDDSSRHLCIEEMILTWTNQHLQDVDTFNLLMIP